MRTKLEKSSLSSEASSSNLQAKEEEEEDEEEEFLTPASSPEICPEPVFTFGSPAAAASAAAERKVSRLEAASVPGVGGGREIRNSRFSKVHFVRETLNLGTSIPIYTIQIIYFLHYHTMQ